MLDELKRCMGSGMVGIKMHPDMHLYAVDGPAYRPAWEFANENALPVLIHTGLGSQWNDPAHLAGPARDFPRAKIVVGHAGSLFPLAESSIRLAKDVPNTYLDLTGSTCPYGLLEWMVAEIGADRVLFGTDLPFLDPRQQLGRVALSRLSEVDKAKILGLNAAQLFRLAD